MRCPPETFDAIIDPLLRFAAGQDLKDASLFRSAFSEDAVLDFVQPARRLGLALEPFRSREGIAHAVLGSTAALVTTHSVTNARLVEFDGRSAKLHALVEAQHLPQDDPSRHLLLKNHYHLALRADGDLWRIVEMTIVNAWMTGDPAVLFPR
jgi:hypothetical protein